LSILKFLNGYHDCYLVVDKKSKSRCFGFVWLKDKESYEHALLIGTIPFRNSHLEISELSKISEFSDRKYNKKVFISGVNHIRDCKILFDIFSQFGVVERVSIKFNKSTGNNRGFGFVIYKNYEMAALAVEKSGSIKYDGKKIKCKFAIPKLFKDEINYTINNSKELVDENCYNSYKNITNTDIIESTNNYFMNFKERNYASRHSTREEKKILFNTNIASLQTSRDFEEASKIYKNNISSYYKSFQAEFQEK